MLREVCAGSAKNGHFPFIVIEEYLAFGKDVFLGIGEIQGRP
jgi:hypothetical protein